MNWKLQTIILIVTLITALGIALLPQLINYINNDYCLDTQWSELDVRKCL